MNGSGVTPTHREQALAELAKARQLLRYARQARETAAYFEARGDQRTPAREASEAARLHIVWAQWHHRNFKTNLNKEYPYV